VTAKPRTVHAVTVEIDTSKLGTYSDEWLAGLWSVAQLNPAPIEDYYAGEIVEKLTAEIVRRFLAKTGAPLYNHQVRHSYWWALREVATYEPGEEDFHAGRWVPKVSEGEKP
jgi:hypothetical protein